MSNKYRLGLEGEESAVTFLTGKAYEILQRRFRNRTGEIDIIARDCEYIVFVEVKYRKGLNYGYPGEAVTKGKQNKIKDMANYYIMKNNLTSDFRFDVIEVIDTGKLEINHIENAFY